MERFEQFYFRFGRFSRESTPLRRFFTNQSCRRVWVQSWLRFPKIVLAAPVPLLVPDKTKFTVVLMVPVSSAAPSPSTAKLRIWTLRIWGFRGPGFRSARQALCGDASRLFLDHFSKHPSSVLGWTELCHEVWRPGSQNPQIIRNENHHLALFDILLLVPESLLEHNDSGVRPGGSELESLASLLWNGRLHLRGHMLGVADPGGHDRSIPVAPAVTGPAASSVKRASEKQDPTAKTFSIGKLGGGYILRVAEILMRLFYLPSVVVIPLPSKEQLRLS